MASSVLHIDYEDVERDPAAAVRQIAAQIGATPLSPAPRSKLIKISGQIDVMRD